MRHYPITTLRPIAGLPGEMAEFRTDAGIRWHAGSPPIVDLDGTSTNSCHHPVFSMIGDGWTWMYSTYRLCWLHESGLHLFPRLHTGDPNNPFDNPALYPALSAAIRAAVDAGATGYHVVACCDGHVTLTPGTPHDPR